ncbi:unnamed protein product [Arabidopsis thaliana]|uniref:ubiquitinyl hydrolase 1 n=1 Tax=Arabidopsis thaliana TaxID=3702 RepID=A0A654EY78_ARATH|nr:unnamed protein product [Arabidopsis thaliana]
MGKRLKKGQKPPYMRFAATVSEKQSEQSVEVTEEFAVTMTEKRSCVHFDKYVDLDKLLKIIKSYQQIKCGECNERVHVKRGSRWGASNRRDWYSSSDQNCATNAIWLCLECGYYVCGDVGLPTEAQSHVMGHNRLTRHRLVIQCENPQLRWCFSCQSLLPFDKEENGSIYGGIEARDGYAVRGLVNLGNTCFFNSVMQNLLSLDQLREHFLKEDLSVSGPLVSSLKELFAESNSEASVFRNEINPGDLFFSVCSQAPQFRGYQQHDSHELLRCLLDGLSIEESSLRKKLGVSDSNDSSTYQKPTLIDSVFGGEISSTVSCLECGHFSKVYEPFMDLSLPVPSMKLPPKKQQILSQAKEVLKNGAVSKDSEVVSAKPASDHNSTVPLFPSDHKIQSRPETSDNETDLVLLSDVSDTAPSTEAKGVNQILVGSTETLMHDNDRTGETVPDKEDVRATQSNEETSASGISAVIDEAQVCGCPDLEQSSSSANQGADEELALMVADSQVLYMPYKDHLFYDDYMVAEASSSFVSGDHEPKKDYFDFSSFLDEPEIREGPVFRPLSKSEVYEAGFKADCSDDKTVSAGKGEASSSFISSDHEQNIDYVDFSSFFDEPEISERPFFRPLSKSEVSEAGFKADCSDDKTVSAGKGEASSSFVSSDHEQNIDYVDFSSFFDEPEISERPFFRPLSKSEVSEAGFMAVSGNDKTVRAGKGETFSSFMSGDNERNIDYVEFTNRIFDDRGTSERPVFGPPSKAKVSEAGFVAVSSDSDPAVLDESDSPVSVDRCLAQFTKHEILSEDNAWHCENCSKNLKLQRLREKRRTKEGLSNRWVNENGASSAFDECRDSSLNQSCIDLENGYKAAPPITKLPNCKEEESAIDDGFVGEENTKQAPITSVTETPLLGGETISSQPASDNECENWEDLAVDSEEVIVKRDARKKVLINKAPPVLTIHLKRFSQDARGRVSKLSGHVDFQEFIDLSKYMDTRCSEEDEPVYRLAGLVEHLGAMSRGHYVSYIRGGHKERRDSDTKEPNSSIWYHASDSQVRPASLEEVLRSEAYILFYERI